MASLELKLQGKFFHKPIAFEFYLGRHGAASMHELEDGGQVTER